MDWLSRIFFGKHSEAYRHRQFRELTVIVAGVLVLCLAAAAGMWFYFKAYPH